MKRALLVVVALVLYALHQDVWFWQDARPLVFGFLPVGLAYHVLYSVAASGLLWLLVQWAWPSHLETAGQPVEPGPGQAAARDRAPSA